MRKQIRLLINELIRLISAKFSGKKSIFRNYFIIEEKYPFNPKMH
jgi:hypothetical protein